MSDPHEPDAATDQPVEPGPSGPPDFSGAVPAPPWAPLGDPSEVSGQTPKKPLSRRLLVLAAVALGTAVGLGGGAFAAWWFLSGGGPQPEEALPASTVAMISIDLDPSASQKIEAIKALRRFPKFADELDLDSKDDLRKLMFDDAFGDDCSELSFDGDLKPWLGDRAAVAAVDVGEDVPAPTIVLAVTDPAKAKAGIEALIECSEPDTGLALGDNFAVLSDSPAHAARILADGKANPLAQDEDFQRMTEAVGDRGVLTFYIAEGAVDFLADQLAEYDAELLGDNRYQPVGAAPDSATFVTANSRSSSGAVTPHPVPCGSLDYYDRKLASFAPLAGTVRFSGGGMELEAVGLGVRGASVVGEQVRRLPADSAAVYAFSIPEEDVEDIVDFVDACDSDVIRQVEVALGVELPDDLKTLVGRSMTLAVGDDIPADLNEVDQPGDVPAGLVIDGDAERITDLIDRIDRWLEQTEDVSLEDVGILVEPHADKVIISPSRAYASSLAKEGSLGEEPKFMAAVPEAARATGIFYLNLDSTISEAIIWLADDGGEDREVLDEIRKNLEPLASLGYATWDEGKESHYLLKVATD